MAKKKPDYSAKAKVWLPNYSFEMDGNAHGVIAAIFGELPPVMRDRVLESLVQTHNQLKSKGK